MKFYNITTLVLSLAAVFIVTSGLICQFPHCDIIKCDPLPSHCDGEVKMGGNYCGCCMACFTKNLGLGDACVEDNRMYPPTELCKDGLSCSYNSSTCEEIPGYVIG